MAVVVCLEVVDIEHDQRQRGRFARGPAPFLVQKVVELASIGDPGEPVEARETQQHLVGFLQLAHHLQEFLLARAAHADAWLPALEVARASYL